MTKREEYKAKKAGKEAIFEQSKEATLKMLDAESAEEESTVVDNTVTELSKPEEPTDKKEPLTFNANLSFNIKPKEPKKVHKNFLIAQDTCEKLAKMSKEHGVSENSIVNEILKQALV